LAAIAPRPFQQLAGGETKHPARLECRLVRGDDHRGAGGGRLLEHALDQLGVLIVDRRQRLVRQDDSGVASERPCHGHSLPFARGHLARVRLAPAGEPERFQCFERAPAEAPIRHRRIHEHEGIDEVFECVQPRQQPLLLIDEGDLAADAAETAPPPSMKAAARNPDLASGRPELAVDEAEQGGLAGAAGTCDLDELATRNAEVDVGENGGTPE
jgi:hypothetical protein